MFIHNYDVGLRFKYTLLIQIYIYREPNPTYKLIKLSIINYQLLINHYQLKKLFLVNR